MSAAENAVHETTARETPVSVATEAATVESLATDAPDITADPLWVRVLELEERPAEDETPTLKKEYKEHSQQMGCFISERRQEIGWTQAALARAVGVSQQTIFAYENGERRVSILMLHKISEALGIPAGMMFLMQLPRQRKIRRDVRVLAEQILALPFMKRRFVREIIDNLNERRAAKAPAAGAADGG